MCTIPRCARLLAALGLLLLLALACGKGADSAGEPAPEGAWTDDVCGLTWVEDAGATTYWEAAVIDCEALDLGGYSWRLPTIGELRCLVDGCEATALDGDCEVDDDCDVIGCLTTHCEGCELDAGGTEGCYLPPDLVGGCDEPHWSGSTQGDERAWLINFRDASVSHGDITERYLVRCVRVDTQEAL